MELSVLPPDSLTALTREAAALASELKTPARTIPIQPLTNAEREVARQMQICNACRYCEGFCAVFPAMTRRLEFGKADIHYLANLCHNCGACLHACQYAPPHEFAVNVPKAMAQVRVQTYADYAWPAALGSLYKRNGLTLCIALAAGLALYLVLAIALTGGLANVPPAGNFYSVFPHGLMVWLFAPIFVFAALALGIGVARFWRNVSPGAMTADAATEATNAALRLTYLGGGHGDGCNNEDDAFSLSRRRFHHLTFYGFLLCFAATSAATIYHYAFGWVAPYGYASLPKLLGISGGIGLLLGTTGLFWLNIKRDPEHGDATQKPMDRGFIALLFLVSATGLALMLARGSGRMALLLAVHLGCVMAFFATMPYGKFAHGIFRCAALLKYAVERRQLTNLRLKSE